MDELRDMHSKNNSLEGVKEKFKKGVIENHENIMTNGKEIVRRRRGSMSRNPKENREELRREFGDIQYEECSDNSMGSNPRWGIVSKKNLFGLKAEPLVENIRKNLVLRGETGRFQMHKFPGSSEDFFSKTIDISDILKRTEEEQFKEVEEFYEMNNRQFFETYGVYACNESLRMLVAHCVVLDSLLKDKYDEIKDICCGRDEQNGMSAIEINLNDSLKIQTSGRAIMIEKDGKKAKVVFDAVSKGERKDILTNINDLEVENVEYSGDSELIAQLQKAMQEQFKSQQKAEIQIDALGEVLQEPVETETQQTKEKVGAQKIIEFMNQNNLEHHDLASALSMVLARATDKTNAEQHIINDDDKNEPKTGEGKSETKTYDGGKSEYEEGVLNAYKFIINNYEVIKNNGDFSSERLNLELEFSLALERLAPSPSCFLGHKNLFGLEAVPFPNEVYDREEQTDTSKALYLRANGGRINGPARNSCAFSNLINISDVFEKEKEEDYVSEFEKFYNMTNRQVFERFGVDANIGNDTNLIAGYIVLDSLLQEKHSEIEMVKSFPGYNLIAINLADGTEIFVNPCEVPGWKKGITIKKDGKEASVDFDTISIGDRSDELTSINDLEVEDVIYSGDSELIVQLQKAMQEQFKSQQRDEDKNQSHISSELPEELTDLGVKKIIDFMKENNLEHHDLSLALTMVSAKTTDKTNAEQHIIGVVDKERVNPENSKSEH